MMNPIRWTWAVLVTLMLAACGGAGVVENEPVPTSTPIPTAPAVARTRYLVQRGDVTNELVFQGRWLPRDQLTLAFETNGQIRNVAVQRGDTVSAGDLLADFDITDLENQLENELIQLEAAQASIESGIEGDADTIQDFEVALANARLNLQSTRNSSPWVQVENARIGVQNAERALENAQRAYDDAVSRPVTLGGGADVTNDDNDLARQANGGNASTVNSAWEQLQNAQTALQQAQNSYLSAAGDFRNWEIRVAQAENDVIVAEANLQRARAGGGVIDPQTQQNLRSAELAVEQTRERIAAGSLFSPIDGVVLEVNVRPGDSVEAFQAVITVGNPEPKEVIANIPFGSAQELSVGQVGVCQIANRPETAVQCIVRYVPLTAQEADQSVRVAATLPEAQDGQLIEVQMPLETSEDTLWAPPEAVRQFRDRTFVILETLNGPQQVAVQIGLRTEERVEILSGVNEGDVLLGE